MFPIPDSIDVWQMVNPHRLEPAFFFFVWGYDSHVVGGLEHDFYDLSDIGKNSPN